MSAKVKSKNVSKISPSAKKSPKGVASKSPKGKVTKSVPAKSSKNGQKVVPAKSKAKVKKPVEEPEDGEEDPSELEDEEDLNGEEEVEKKKRVKPTIYDHIAHYDQLLDLINSEIDRKSRSMEHGVRPLQRVRKLVTDMRKELPRVTRSKEARLALSTRKNTSSGLTMKYYVSEELAKFLQIDASVDTVSRIDATRAICAYANLKEDEQRETTLAWAYLNPGRKRNLQNPANKKTIIPDKALASLLRKKAGTAKGGGDALEYTSIQSLINHHFLEAATKPNEEVEAEDENDEGEEDENDEGEVEGDGVEEGDEVEEN